MWEKLDSWKFNYLSQAGRLVLIKSTLDVIPAYIMQYQKLPKKICHTIDKIQRNFLWRSTSKKRKLHYINWDKITSPKDKGGLGLHKAELKKQALISGLSWRMFTNSTALWAKALLLKYNHHLTRPSTSFS